MSIQERAIRSLTAQERFYVPRTQQRYAEALKKAQDAADMREAERALRNGDIDAAVAALFPPLSLGNMSSDLNVAAIRVMLASAKRTMQNDVTASIRVRAAQAPTTAVIRALESFATTRVQPLVERSSDAVRALLQIGLEEGVHPTVVARWGRAGIGLTEYDAGLVKSYAELLHGAPQDALSRTLRNGRLDGQVLKWARGEAVASSQDIATHVAGYMNGLRGWRAETFARSTTLDALKQGQLVAWQDAAETAGIDAERLIKTWITTLDGRERDEHRAAHGMMVGIEEVFAVDGGVMTPGENVYNCRCGMTVRLLPAKRSSAVAFMHSRERGFAAQRAAAGR